jgi:hypothetical protein
MSASWPLRGAVPHRRAVATVRVIHRTARGAAPPARLGDGRPRRGQDRDVDAPARAEEGRFEQRPSGGEGSISRPRCRCLFGPPARAAVTGRVRRRGAHRTSLRAPRVPERDHAAVLRCVPHARGGQHAFAQCSELPPVRERICLAEQRMAGRADLRPSTRTVRGAGARLLSWFTLRAGEHRYPYDPDNAMARLREAGFFEVGTREFDDLRDYNPRALFVCGVGWKAAG